MTTDERQARDNMRDVIARLEDNYWHIIEFEARKRVLNALRAGQALADVERNGAGSGRVYMEIYKAFLAAFPEEETTDKDDELEFACPICEGGNGRPCNSHFGV